MDGRNGVLIVRTLMRPAKEGVSRDDGVFGAAGMGVRCRCIRLMRDGGRRK